MTVQRIDIARHSPLWWVASWLLFCTLAMPACVLPPAQNDTILASPPLIYNRPPHIIEQLVSPPRYVQLTPGGGIGSTPFSVQVEDPDLCDSITVVWYLDYNPALHTPPIYTPDPVNQPFAPNANTNPIRDLSSTDLGPTSTPAFSNSAQNPLSVGPHVLEAFVADIGGPPGTSLFGALGPDNVTTGGRNVTGRTQFEICYSPPYQPCDGGVGCVTPALTDVTLADGGTAVDPAYFSTYAWTIEVCTPGTCP